jgi:hypothetical protein
MAVWAVAPRLDIAVARAPPARLNPLAIAVMRRKPRRLIRELGGFNNSFIGHVEGPVQSIYPPITQISADLNMRRAHKEKESANICEIGG